MLWAAAAPVFSQYGDALAGKVIVDITNLFNPTSTGLAIPADTSSAQEIAKAAPASAGVIKAFNKRQPSLRIACTVRKVLASSPSLPAR